MINLISDTVTKPTPAMLEHMIKAPVGDDVFNEDPSVNALQERVADMFGKEAALFCPSGTMTNQIAIKIHTKPLDDLICDIDSHVYQAEVGGYAYHSGVGISLIQGTNGKITDSQVEGALKPGHDWQPISRLVVLENTCNKGGGSYYTIEEIIPIAALCKQKNLRLHLDGARLFNALAETGEDPKLWGKYFDTIAVCMSKGLGAPVGSLLTGDRDVIREARRIRKVMGGGMRQAGYLAAACDYALDHHVDRLKQDHLAAKKIGETLQHMPYVKSLKPVHTNIVIFELADGIHDSVFIHRLKEKGILASPFGGNTIRFVTHLDVTHEMISKVCSVLQTM